MPPSINPRVISPLDKAISHLDQTLRTLFGAHSPSRPNPAGTLPETVIQPATRAHLAKLMRVNHAGEVAAQALYHGQALTARSASTRESMVTAAAEETDHLAWCAERITELGGRRSLLDPLWYVGSFSIGAVAGLAGDRVSLGFVAETEKQVVQHLDSHLQQLPSDDARTRVIIEKMRADEDRHGQDATNAGGAQLPPPIQSLMQLTARIMTRTAYWL